jgi:hypothetical protein
MADFPEHSPERSRRRVWFVLINSAVKELRPLLQMDEASYTFVSVEAHAQSRDFLLYGILDEVQKSATAILRWDELLEGTEGPGAVDADSEEDRQVLRVVLEATRDEQSMWIRKLVEALGTLICFSTCDEAAYYRHFLLLSSLRERRAIALDLDRSYACPSRNLAFSIDQLAEEIAMLEASGAVAIERSWYVSRKTPRSKDELNRVRVRDVLVSEAARTKTAFEHASADEALVLGISYDRIYGRASRDIHFGPPRLQRSPSIELIAQNSEDVALLCRAIIHRVQLLTQQCPPGANRILRDSLDSSPAAAVLAQQTRSDASVGDFVLAETAPAEVLEIVESELGYQSYLVRFVADQPLESIDTDWIPAQYIRVLFRRTELLAPDRSGTRLPSEMTDALAELHGLSPEKVDQALRDSLAHVWASGLRDWIRTNWFRR